MSDIDLREYYDQSYPPSVFVQPVKTGGTGTTAQPAQTGGTGTTAQPAPDPPAADENI